MSQIWACFKILAWSLSKGEIRQDITQDSHARNARADVIVRSPVSSGFVFENGQRATDDSCTIATAFRFVSKNGEALYSSGTAEVELLRKIQDA